MCAPSECAAADQFARARMELTNLQVAVKVPQEHLALSHSSGELNSASWLGRGAFGLFVLRSLGNRERSTSPRTSDSRMNLSGLSPRLDVRSSSKFCGYQSAKMVSGCSTHTTSADV